MACHNASGVLLRPNASQEGAHPVASSPSGGTDGVAFTASAVGRVLGAAAPSTEIAEWAVIPDEYPAMTPSTASLERVVATTTDGRRIRSSRRRSSRSATRRRSRPSPMRSGRRRSRDSPGILKLTSTPRGSLPTCPTACGRRGSFSSRSSATTGPGCGSRTWRPLRPRGISPGTRSRPAPSDASPAGSLPPAFLLTYRPSAWASGRSSVCGSRAPSSHHSEVTRPGATRSCGLRWPPTQSSRRPPCTGRRRAAAPRCPRRPAANAGPLGRLPAEPPCRSRAGGRARRDRLELHDLRADWIRSWPATRRSCPDWRTAPGRAARDPRAIVPAYLEGLRNEGVDADPADVRTGYVGSLLLRSGFTGPPLELLGRSDEPGIADLFGQRARYTRFLLDLRGEVRLQT